MRVGILFDSISGLSILGHSPVAVDRLSRRVFEIYELCWPSKAAAGGLNHFRDFQQQCLAKRKKLRPVCGQDIGEKLEFDGLWSKIRESDVGGLSLYARVFRQTVLNPVQH